MSTPYNADGTVPQASNPWVRAPILDSTNAAPIVLHVVAHGYTEGDTVGVEGHDVNTNANGLHTIHVVDADHFWLVGTTGNGVGGTTGYTIDYSVNPVITLPSDGDLVNASSVDPALEALFNTVPYLYRRAGKYSLFDVYHSSAVASANAPFAIAKAFNTVTLTGGVWNALFPGVMNFGAPPPALLPGDRLSVDFCFSPQILGLAESGGTGSKTEFGWALALEVGGSGYVLLEESMQNQYATPGSGGVAGYADAIHLYSEFSVGSGGDSFDLEVQAYPRVDPAGTLTINFLGAWEMIIHHYRRNT